MPTGSNYATRLIAMKKTIQKVPRRNIADKLIKTASILPFTPFDTQDRPGDFQFILTTEETDTEGDIIRTKGIDLTGFLDNPVALFAHSGIRPIGTWVDLKREKGKLTGWLKLAAAGTLPDADTVRSLLDQGIIKTCSVGIHVLDYEFIGEGSWSVDIKKSLLTEVSVVAIPANASARRIKQKTVQSNSKKPKGQAHIMKLSEKIIVKQQRLAAIDDELAKLSEMDELSAEDDAMLSALSDEKITEQKSLDQFSILESLLGDRAKQVSKDADVTALMPGYVGGADPSKPEDLLFKMASINLIAFHQKKSPEQVIKERYKSDKTVSKIEKTLSTPAGTSSATIDDLLIESRGAFMDLLTPVSVYAQLSKLGQSIDFGSNGTIKIPGRSASAAHGVSGAFVGELGAIPVKTVGMTSQTLHRYKMAVISTFSKEIIEYSTPQIESIVRRAMIDDTAEAVDAVLLDAKPAVTGVRPASILNGITAAASSGATATNIVADLKAAWKPMMDGHGGRVPVIVMSTATLLGLQTVTVATGGFLFRDELATGKILGLKVIKSTGVPAGTVFVLDAADFSTAFGSPQFSTSDETSIVLANADGVAPTMAGDANDFTGGDINAGHTDEVLPQGGLSLTGATGTSTTGNTAISMFQTHALALKMVMPISWAHLRPTMIGALKSVAW